MSCALTFYSGAYQKLEKKLMRRDAAFVAAVRDAWELVYDPTKGKNVDQALKEGFHEVTQRLRSQEDGALSQKGQLVMVAAVLASAREIGPLLHSNAGGEKFRHDFLGGLAAKCFKEPRLGIYLTDRPLFGVASDGNSEWGYLLRDEVRRLLSNYQPPSPLPTDFDHHRWITDLKIILERAEEAGEDLITLYR